MRGLRCLGCASGSERSFERVGWRIELIRQLKSGGPRPSRAPADRFANLTDIEGFKWCPHTDSNRGPTDYKSVALPAEL